MHTIVSDFQAYKISFVAIWKQALEAGFSSAEAREYAYLEMEKIISESKNKQLVKQNKI